MKIEIKIPSQKILIKLAVVAALLIILVLFGGPRFVLFVQDTFTPFSSSWEAIYLTNGEIYIGHIRATTRHVVKFSDAYLVNVARSQESEANSKKFSVAGSVGNNISLIKWGFYQPLKSKGELFISRSNILFWEKLDSDSEVVKQLEAQK